MGDEADSVNTAITNYLKKMTKVYFNMTISDPIMLMDIKKIGDKVAFNPMRHESMDGFVKNK